MFGTGILTFGIGILSSRFPAGCSERRGNSWDPSSAPYFHVRGREQSDPWASASVAALIKNVASHELRWA